MNKKLLPLLISGLLLAGCSEQALEENAQPATTVETVHTDTETAAVSSKATADKAETVDNVAAEETEQKETTTPVAVVPKSERMSQDCPSPDIKGNISASGEKIYHVPGDQSHEETVAEEVFCATKYAEQAGYRPSVR